MGAPAKFLFDLDLSANAAKDIAATPADIAAQIAEAESSGYRNGFTAAQAEAEAHVQRRLAVAFDQIGRSLASVASSLDRVEARLETEAVEVALATARKLSEALIAREPLTEITELVAGCFHELVTAPHLVVRVNDELYKSARGRIEELARKSGFDGRLIILAEPDIAMGDCRIEWADGGIVRERAATEARIADMVHRYIAARLQAKHDNHGMNAGSSQGLEP